MTQTIVIEDTLWEGANGGAIFRGSTMTGARHRFVANRQVMPRPPLAGEIWAITGRIVTHPEHGKQVVAEAAVLHKPSGKLIVQTISKSKLFPGIGRSRAQKLWEAMGEDIYEGLNKADRAPFVGLLGVDLAEVLFSGWRRLSVEAEVYQYLDQHGLPLWISNKLIIIYGNDVISKIEENPYRLLAFTSWKQADLVARSIGVDNLDVRRLIAATEAVSYQRLQFSHTWTSVNEFQSSIRRLLRCDADTAQLAIKLAIDDHAIIELDGGLQGVGPAAMERFIAERFQAMTAGNFEASQRPIQSIPLDDMESVIGSFEEQEGITLNQAQRDAVCIALAEPLSVITGGAGVGKTTVLKAIHEASERLGGHIHQMALAGRAAKRMTEASGKPATTIMGFLQAVDAGQIKLDTSPTLVIDEASMVDLPTMYRILRRMEPGARLLLVGDPAQLPPIGFGLVFHAMCKADNIPRIELTEIHRQAASTGIPQVSRDVRTGVIPTLNEYSGKGVGVSFISCDKQNIAERVMDVTNDLGGVAATQIVGAVKNGAAGTRVINDLFHQLISPGRRERLNYAEGEPVMWTVNDYEINLMNGSLGVVRSASDELEIEFDGQLMTIPDAAVSNMEHAYAITCHKSQGSQFKQVIIPIVKSRILDRTLLYTAITRAQEQVVLIGDRDAFEKAIQSPPNPDNRETGISTALTIKL